MEEDGVRGIGTTASRGVGASGGGRGRGLGASRSRGGKLRGAASRGGFRAPIPETAPDAPSPEVVPMVETNAKPDVVDVVVDTDKKHKHKSKLDLKDKAKSKQNLKSGKSKLKQSKKSKANILTDDKDRSTATDASVDMESIAPSFVEPSLLEDKNKTTKDSKKVTNPLIAYDIKLQIDSPQLPNSKGIKPKQPLEIKDDIPKLKWLWFLDDSYHDREMFAVLEQTTRAVAEKEGLGHHPLTGKMLNLPCSAICSLSDVMILVSIIAICIATGIFVSSIMLYSIAVDEHSYTQKHIEGHFPQ